MTSKYYDYLLGYDQVYLTRKMIHADWGNNPRAVEFTNFAFKLYYQMRRNLDRYRPTDKKHIKFKKELIDKLEEATKKGSSILHWGDLNTAFKKLGRDGADRNQWRDSKTMTFKGATPKGVVIGAKKSIWKGNVVAPAAVVEFMTVVDQHIQELSAFAEAHIKHSKIVVNAANDPAANWKLINKSLAFISTNADRASQYLWLAPATLSLTNKGATLSKKASLYIEKGETFFSTVSKISGYASKILQVGDDFVKYKKTGMTNEDAAEMAILKSALGYLPILGSFYAEALDLIPGLKKWFQNLVKDYTAQIDAIPGLWTQQATAYKYPNRRTSPSTYLPTGFGRQMGRIPGPQGLA